MQERSFLAHRIKELEARLAPKRPPPGARGVASSAAAGPGAARKLADAIEAEDHLLVSLLLRAGVVPTHAMLLAACRTADSDLVETILRHGAPVAAATDGKTDTPMLIACQRRRRRGIARLLDRG